MQTIVRNEDKKDVKNIEEFLRTLTEEEQQQAYIFIQGARIGARVMQGKCKEPA